MFKNYLINFDHHHKLYLSELSLLINYYKNLLTHFQQYRELPQKFC